MAPSPPQAWSDLAAQQLVRYEALFQLLEDIQALDDIAAIAARAAGQWKYFANVGHWRMVIASGDGFVVVDGVGGGATITDVQTLSAWDAHHWLGQRPQRIGLPAPPEWPALPGHLAEGGPVEVLVLPFVRMGRSVGLLSACAAQTLFSDLDEKFIRLFGGHLADRVSGLVLRRQAIAALTAKATHDPLTGLFNRSAFVDAIRQAAGRTRGWSQSFAVLYLDLDHFKDINDTLGRPAGDQLLKLVGSRLDQGVRETDTVARFGGDEFAVLAEGVRSPSDAADLADKLLKAIAEPFMVESSELRIGASVGVAVHGSGAIDPETLLSQADVALYRAKGEGRGAYRFFTEAMDEEMRARVALSRDLHNGVAAGQLLLMYQPQVDTRDGAIVGIEALVRWRHPVRGLVSPAEFIPVAEKTGLILAIGRWVLLEACRQQKAWLDAGVAPPVMAVNVSGLQFRSPLELERDVTDAVRLSGLPRDRLQFELTESVLMEAARANTDALTRLRQAGHSIAIDDFGIGYSSLGYLVDFPVDCVKIAQTFLPNLTESRRNAAIVKAAISLALELDLEVLTEGVETREQLDLIESWRCHRVQGYYYSRPLSAEAATEALRKGRLLPASAVTPDVA